jgi:hypothetical protein
MALFRKYLKPEDLGASLYELLRSGLESESDLSLSRLLRNLEIEQGDLHNQYAGDVMVALMFAATMAVERSASNRVAKAIVSGMKSEFANHLEEQGANPVQQAEWELTLADTFLMYRSCLENYSGFEPPWRLGRQFYWNLLGREEYVAMSIKIATLYLLTARDMAQNLLNKLGPMVLVAEKRN